MQEHFEGLDEFPQLIGLGRYSDKTETLFVAAYIYIYIVWGQFGRHAGTVLENSSSGRMSSKSLREKSEKSEKSDE